jgi:hypothetical protein
MALALAVSPKVGEGPIDCALLDSTMIRLPFLSPLIFLKGRYSLLALIPEMHLPLNNLSTLSSKVIDSNRQWQESIQFQSLSTNNFANHIIFGYHLYRYLLYHFWNNQVHL